MLIANDCYVFFIHYFILLKHLTSISFFLSSCKERLLTCTIWNVAMFRIGTVYTSWKEKLFSGSFYSFLCFFKEAEENKTDKFSSMAFKIKENLLFSKLLIFFCLSFSCMCFSFTIDKWITEIILIKIRILFFF